MNATTLPLLSVPAAAQPHWLYDQSKRMVDIIGAVILLTLTSPILLGAVLLTLLTSGRPVFFGQVRLGYQAKPFRCWKLRTMVRDAEKLRDEVIHLNATDGPTFKCEEDPRVTKVGKFLRRTSLDELPQFCNVLLGQMSLVGPRPLPVIENQYVDGQDRRLSVKPGITCTWQISGRSSIPFQQWMKMDLMYVHKRSLWYDLELLLKTPAAVLLRRGAA